MKITMNEYEKSFSFSMEAETMADAALLARYAINVTSEVMAAESYANTDGTVAGYCVLGKRRKATSTIARSK